MSVQIKIEYIALPFVCYQSMQNRVLQMATGVSEEECDNAFDTLKQALVNPPLLAYPDFMKEFMMVQYSECIYSNLLLNV